MLIVVLMYEGGLAKMNWSISDSAEYGGYTRGPRVINDETRQEMRRILAEVQDGTFARQLVEEFDGGQKEFTKHREELAENPIEKTGATLRPMMSWLKA
jgi:ketol-acid reductoisomerase